MTWGGGWGGSGGSSGGGWKNAPSAGSPYVPLGTGGGGGGGGGESFFSWITPDQIENPIRHLGDKVVPDQVGEAVRNLIFYNPANYSAGLPKLGVAIGRSLLHDTLVRPGTSLFHGHPLGALEHEVQAAVGLGTLGVVGWKDKGKQQLESVDLLRATGEGFVGSYLHKYNPMEGGISGVAERAFVKDPLGTLLDISVAGRLLGAGAKAAAAGGRLGEGAEALSKYRPKRVYTPFGEGAEGPVLVKPYEPARTLQGLYRQRWMDNFAREHQFMPVLGNQARVGRVLARERRYKTAIFSRLAKQEQVMRGNLTPDEIQVTNVVLEGARDSADPIGDLVRFYEKRAENPISEESARGIQMQLDRLQGIDKSVIENPRPEYLKYIEHLRKMDDVASEAAQAGGRLAAMSREARRFLPQRIMEGGRVKSNKGLVKANKRATKAQLARLNRQQKHLDERMVRHQTRLTDETRNVNRLQSQVDQAESVAGRIEPGGPLSEPLKPGQKTKLPKAKKTKAPAGLPTLRHELGLAKKRQETAQRNVDMVQSQLDQHAERIAIAKAERKAAKGAEVRKDWVGGPAIEDLQAREQAALSGTGPAGPLAQFGPAFRNPHFEVLPENAAGQFLERVKSMITRDPKVPGVYKFNEGKLFMSGLLAAHPERFSADFMTQMQYAHARDVLKHQVLPVTREIDPNRPFNSQTEVFVQSRPATRIRREPVELDKAIRGRVGELRQAGEEFDSWVQDQVAKGIPDAYYGKTRNESAALKKMKQDGWRIAPKDAAKLWEREMGRTSESVRFFWDKGIMAAWRYLTLNLVPRWMVNNAVTSMTLYALNYAGRDGIRSFADAIKSDPVLNKKWWGKIQASARGQLDRPASRLAQEYAPQLEATTFSEAERLRGGFGAGTPHEGFFSAKGERRFLRTIKAAQKTGRSARVTGTYVRGAVKAWGRVIANFNAEAENISRDAAFLAEARQAMRKAGNVNRDLEQVGRWLDEKRAVDPMFVENLGQKAIDVMGDFNNLSKRERSIRRWAVPFYSWYKAITLVNAKFVAREPIRAAILYHLGQAAQGNPDVNLGFPVPAYGESWAPVAGDQSGQSGGAVAVLSPVGANPFQTTVDLEQMAANLGGVQSDEGSMASPASLLNPYLQAGITTLTGQDTFFGGEYHGPGASHGPVASGIGSLIDVPQQRLYEQLTGGYKSRTFSTTGPSPVPILNRGQFDGILQYLGIPIRHVDPQGARQRAGEKKAYG